MFSLDAIVAWAKRKAFVYPGSDIYGGLENAWDYGPYGVQLKRNIENLWRNEFVEKRDDMVGLDAQILMHPKTREASGHLEGFNDPLIDDKETGERFRADKIIEEEIDSTKENYLGLLGFLTSTYEMYVNELDELIGQINYYNNRNLPKPLIDSIEQQKDKEEFIKKIDPILKSFFETKDVDELILNFFNSSTNSSNLKVSNLIPESRTYDQMKAFIEKYIPNNPNTGNKADWTDVRNFELMFYTYQGVVHEDHNKIWMRPETAQGIFVNFKNILDTTRVRVPFGIGQIGKAFRNEITPGNFLYRTREFEQMEIEYFVHEDEAEKFFDQWQKESMDFWYDKVHLSEDNLRFREHESDELSHYSKGTFDVEFKYPWGWGELQGIAWRGDFDLSQHQEHSGKDLRYIDPYTGKRYLPHVIEPSFGLSRTVLAVMFDAYDEEKYEDGGGNEQTRVVAKFHKSIAPVKFAIFPLVKKDDDQVAIAKELYEKLSENYYCEYDESGNIGKRYRRQDEIGTPFCITVDYDSADDQTVTIRDRDSMEQIRVPVDKVVEAMKMSRKELKKTYPEE